MKHVSLKKWSTHDVLCTHKGYRSLLSLLSLRMLESIGLLFANDKRRRTEPAMNNAIELQVSVTWKLITDISYVFNSRKKLRYKIVLGRVETQQL